MNEIAVFNLLKQKVETTYKLSFPYFTGTIHDFGNKEIAQFIDLIDEKIKERISEKWIYTHLKPKLNDKLPRKDMLDILSKFVGENSWEQFYFNNSNEEKQPEVVEKSNFFNSKITKIMTLAGIGGILISVVFGVNNLQHRFDRTICFKDKYTQKIVESDKFEVFEIDKKLKTTSGCLDLKLEKEIELRIESPYYKAQNIVIKPNQEITEIELIPDDYAMMLRAYMNSDLKNWNKRKAQLEEIISEDAEIEEVSFNEIGVEFLNKQEFIDKIITPSETMKKMEIIEIKYENNKIISLKFIQK